MSHKAIVLDANILIRAVLGKRVRGLIIDNAAQVKFFAPDVAYINGVYINGVRHHLCRSSSS